ncbi:MAG: YgiT-type zinc finger protein [Nitrospirota bacterium]
MKCLFCNGEMEKKKVAYTVNRKGYHLYVEKIPAFVCSRCGEQFFDEKEVGAIQNMLKAFEEKLEQVEMA